jgi:hypothetical protein
LQRYWEATKHSSVLQWEKARVARCLGPN